MSAFLRQAFLFSAIFGFWFVASAAERTAAILTSSGPVWTNATALPSGGAVYPGDRIRTGENGLAAITSSDSRVEIRPESEITWQDDGIVLETGSVASNGNAVRFGENTAKPAAPGEAWFVVAEIGGRSQVAAHRGGVTIGGPGLSPLLIPAGSYAVAAGGEREEGSADGDSEGNAADAKKPKKNRKKNKQRRAAGRGAAAAGGVAGKAAGGWTIGTLSHAASVALAAGVGAAATGAAIAAVTLDEPSPSPSQ